MLDLNSSAWSKVYTVNLNAKPILGKQGQFQPIPNVRMPVSLEKHTLLVGASSIRTKPRWKLGFWLSMELGKISGIGQPTIPDIFIPLGLLYVKLPKLTANYTLIAKIPHWHTQLSIDIWKYLGSEPASIESLSESLVEGNQARIAQTTTIMPGQIPGLF